VIPALAALLSSQPTSPRGTGLRGLVRFPSVTHVAPESRLNYPKAQTSASSTTFSPSPIGHHFDRRRRSSRLKQLEKKNQHLNWPFDSSSHPKALSSFIRPRFRCSWPLGLTDKVQEAETPTNDKGFELG
jgi:hypothetical protein